MSTYAVTCIKIPWPKVLLTLLNSFDMIFNLDFFNWANFSCTFRTRPHIADHYFKMRVVSLLPFVITLAIFCFYKIRKLWLVRRSDSIKPIPIVLRFTRVSSTRRLGTNVLRCPSVLSPSS